MKIKKAHKLRAYWSDKENDLMLYHPLGCQTSCDAGYLAFEIFNKDFVEEIQKRGYDIRTLKFEISPKLPNERKFETLTKLYSEEHPNAHQ